ncbi:MAG: DUF169 domain-containing protein [Chlorobiaceae bacterium]|nr:DUF169 domain-containing protein [Chlorobiaceae bacterium]NTV61464.1 DUF169 domain-containing protein [Chlorobiaceae bacterium]
MTPEQLSQALVESEGLAYHPIAIKFVSSPGDLPEGIRKFGASSGEQNPKSFLCAMWGDCFRGAGPFYTTREDHYCGGGTIAAGFGSLLPIEAAEKFMIGDGKLFGNMQALRCSMETTMPFRDGEFAAQIVGPLAAMNEDELRPDVVLIVCKPFQGQHILRAYGFDSGEVAHGIAGGSTCEMVSSYVVKTGKPTFTLGDTGGNAGLSLAPDELLVAFPYDKLETAVANLPRICRTSNMPRFTIVHER